MYHVSYLYLPWIWWIFKVLQLTLFRHKDSKLFRILCFFVGLALFVVVTVLLSLLWLSSFYFFIENPPLHIDIVVRLKILQRRFFQFLWVSSFIQPIIVNFVFTKLAEMHNKCTTCACGFLYNWIWCSDDVTTEVSYFWGWRINRSLIFWEESFMIQN